MDKLHRFLILDLEIGIVLQQKQTFRFDFRFPVSVTIQFGTKFETGTVSPMKIPMNQREVIS